jgi:hypothetical protein
MIGIDRCPLILPNIAAKDLGRIIAPIGGAAAAELDAANDALVTVHGSTGKWCGNPFSKPFHRHDATSLYDCVKLKELR